MDIKEAIKKVVNFEDLTEEETRSAFEIIMSGEATPAQVAAFIVALRMKVETVGEITGAAEVMREKAAKIKVKKKPVLDTCGTGGSGIDRFNISTAVAFVLAGSGVTVAKHGNRSASSKCGSADVLEELGVKIDVPVKVAEKCINSIGIGFMFAPLYHSAMKHAVGPRKEVGVRTIFNIIGPLSNPASATCQVLGVFNAEVTETMAEVLGNLGVDKAYVVHGDDGLDEVTITARTKVSEFDKGELSTYYVEPEEFGLKKGKLEDIKGGTAKENAKIIKDILSGKKGPKRDIVLANSSMALMAAGKASDLKKGVKMAAESIDSGKAEEKLEELIKMTNEGVE